MCGSTAGSVPAAQQTIRVNGDLFNSDTRSALAILKIGEMNPEHKQQDGNIQGDIMSQMSSLTPVIEFEGKNIMGSTKEIIINCSL